MKAAIIGLGSIAPVHAQAILRAEGEITAICDIEEEKTAAFGAKFAPGARRFSDWKTMLASLRGEADVIHITTPHYLHADMVCAALGAGFSVLCEKPLCIREEDIGRILAAERAAGGMLGVCLQNRYNESNRALFSLCGEKPAAAGFGSVVWERDENYYRSGAWRGKWATEGGGVMINQALHTLDLLLCVMGDPVSVVATTENRHLGGKIEVEDTASARFLTADGRSFSFFATTGGGADFPVQLMVKTAAGDTVVAANDTLTVNGEIRPSESGTVRYGKDVWGDGHAHLVADFYDAVAHGRHFAIDGAEGARVVRAILAMYRSGGKEVGV